MSVVTKESIPVGTVIEIKNYFNKPVHQLSAHAKVVWSSVGPSGYISGLEFQDHDNALSPIVRIFSRYQKLNPLKYILLLGIPLIAMFLGCFWWKFPYQEYGTAFILFMAFLATERVWETFFTSKEFKSTTSSSDWSMTAVSFYYIVLILFVIAEFFLRPTEKIAITSVLGGMFLVFSFSLRWYAMKTLGSEWRVHATDSTRRAQGQEVLIRKGPYGFIRHPIYLAVIFELLAIPLIAQTYLSLLFSVLVNIPLQVLRSRLEEAKSIEIYGLNYAQYMNEVPGFIPRRNK